VVIVIYPKVREEGAKVTVVTLLSSICPSPGEGFAPKVRDQVVTQEDNASTYLMSVSLNLYLKHSFGNSTRRNLTS
jgi:hypothetical protein